MAAGEMPWASASFLKSASQVLKLPVVRQLAVCAAAGAGPRARRPAVEAPAINAARAVRIRTQPATAMTLCRIEPPVGALMIVESITLETIGVGRIIRGKGMLG